MIVRDHLTLDGSNLSGSTDMWKGIIVEDSKSIVVKNLNHIQDADEAVQLGDGARTHIVDSGFENNRICITNKGSSIINRGLRNNDFLGGTLLNGNYSHSAINIHDMVDFTYPTLNNGQKATDNSSFSSFPVAISCTQSIVDLSYLVILNGVDEQVGVSLTNMIQASVSHSSFLGGLRGIEASGDLARLQFLYNNFHSISGTSASAININNVDNGELLILDNDFDQCDEGISLWHTTFSPGLHARIRLNQFTNGNSTQIRINNCDNVDILTNKIYDMSSSFYPIRILNGHYIVAENNDIDLHTNFSLSGISATGGSNISFRDNEITGSNTGNGRGLNRSGGSNYFVCGNTVSSLKEGISFTNVDLTTKFLHNTMDGNDDDLKIWFTGIGEQRHAGNRWVGLNTESEVFAPGNAQTIAVESQLIINPNDLTLDPELRSVFVTPSSIDQFFFPEDPDNSALSSISCSSEDPYNQFPDENDPCFPDCIGDPPPPEDCESLLKMLEAIVNDTATTLYPNRTHWQLQQMILNWYESITLEYQLPPMTRDYWPELDSLMQVFIGDEQGTDLSLQQHLKGQLNYARSFNRSNWLAFYHAQERIEGLLSGIRSLDPYTQENQIGLLNDTLMTELNRTALKRTNLDMQKNLSQAYILGSMAQIGQPFAFVEQHNDMLEIETRLLTRTVDQLSQADKNTLQSIANMCALEIGEPVYKARIYHHELGGPEVENYDDDFICSSSQSRSSNKKPSQEFEIYPNPVQNRLELRSPHKDVFIDIRIFNISGQLVQQQKKIDFKNAHILDTSSLTSGIYILRIQELDTDKIHSYMFTKVKD